MADFVSNFLEGLQQKRQREDQQAARAEQVRQFEMNRLQRQREFDTENRLAQQRQAIDQARFKREGERQDLQDRMSAANLISQGQAEQSIAGLDENVPGRVELGNLGGLDVTLLGPEERSDRETQLLVGNFKNRVNLAAQQIEQEQGPEAAQQFKAQIMTPTNIAQILGVKSPERDRPLQSANQFFAEGLAEKVRNKELTLDQAMKKAQEFNDMRRASEIARVPGALGVETTQPASFQAEELSLRLAPFARQISGITPELAREDPSEAARQIAAGLIDAKQRRVGPFAAGQPFGEEFPDDQLILSAAQRIATALAARAPVKKTSNFRERTKELEDARRKEATQ